MPPVVERHENWLFKKKNEMRSASFLLITICLFATSLSIAQPSDFDAKRFIEWNEHYKLSWDHFENTVDDGRFGDAGTAVKIIAKPYFVGKSIEYNVYALFDRQKSWAFEKDDALLAHEQLHFDIAELYARKIRKKVEELRKGKIKELSDYNKAINKI